VRNKSSAIAHLRRDGFPRKRPSSKTPSFGTLAHIGWVLPSELAVTLLFQGAACDLESLLLMIILPLEPKSVLNWKRLAWQFAAKPLTD
jgi:hypothetical protein